MTLEQLIAKYFKNGLSAKEQEQLDVLLNNDATLAESFEFEKNLKASLIDSGKDTLRGQFNQLELTIQEQEAENKSRSSFLKYAIAAVLIIGSTLFVVKSFSSAQVSSDELYAQYFEPYRNVIAPIQRGETVQTEEEKVFANYEMRDYQTALAGFRMLKEKSNQDYLVLYEGVTLMQLNQYEQAIIVFNTFPKNKNKFADKLQWYLSLAYLKTEKITEAKALLQLIIEKNGYKREAAQNIMKSL